MNIQTAALNDQDLQSINGGFLGALFKTVAKAAPKVTKDILIYEGASSIIEKTIPTQQA